MVKASQFAYLNKLKNTMINLRILFLTVDPKSLKLITECLIKTRHIGILVMFLASDISSVSLSSLTSNFFVISLTNRRSLNESLTSRM